MKNLTPKQKLFLALAGLIFIIGIFVLIYRTYFLVTPSLQSYQEITQNKKNSTSIVFNQAEKNKEYILVYFIGAVKNPGIYKLPKGKRIFEAIEIAGGFLPNADLTKVDLAKKCRDSQKINVPFQKEIKKNIKKETTISNPIDLNKANLKELMTIPGI
ncbi:MAG: SLBB domain-containing protein, partial [Candidatus Margulisiibacteriota bacterium]